MGKPEKIPCPACKKAISSEAQTCPKCGHPLTAEEREKGLANVLKRKKKAKIAWLVVIGFIFLLGIIGSQSSKGKKDQPEAKTITETTAGSNVVGTKPHFTLQELNNAIENGDVDKVKIIITQNKKILLQEKDVATPLWRAIDKHNFEIAKILIDNGAPDASKELCSAISNDIRIAKYMVERGIRSCESAIHHAVINSKGKIETIEYLISAKFDVNELKPGSNDSALHVAASRGWISICDLLLKNDANANAANADMVTPLMAASRKGDIDVCTLLLKYNANPNAASKGGYTSMHTAAMSGSVEVCTLLLKNRANINPISMHGSTPFDEAMIAGKENLAQFLAKNGGKRGPAFSKSQ